MAYGRRYTNRVDANQAAIVEALRQAGAVVEIIGQPVDLLVGYWGRWTLVEVKDGSKPPNKQRLKPSQEAFFARCEVSGLPAVVVRSVEQAIEYIIGVGQ